MMPRRPPVLARGGMVAASHPLAAEAGASVLRAGGHAVDAAVAAGAVLSVVEPSASGLGGDAFLLIYDSTDAAVAAINGSGAAPAALSAHSLGAALAPGKGGTGAPRGPALATVPGCVAAWGEAWYGWGRLEWHRLLAPAIELARGFPVSWRMGQVLRESRAFLSADPESSRLFLNADGTPLRAGQICRPIALSRTLAQLAEEGAEAFYTGALAERLCRGVREAGGLLAVGDLEAHESEIGPPIESSELGTGGSTRAGVQRVGVQRVLCEQPLPSQGLLLQVMLGLLARGRGASSGHKPWIELHRQVQAKVIAFALRDAFFADPRFLPVPAAELADCLLDGIVLDGLSKLLDREPLSSASAQETVLTAFRETGAQARALDQRYREAGFDPNIGGLVDSGLDTTYLCTADAQGNVCGLIQSIFRPFGCGFLEPSTGVLLNNRAMGFSLDPHRVNRVEPGKRTLHTLNSWMLLEDGRPWMIGGTPGADRQVQTSLQVLRHVLEGGVRWPGPMPMQPGKWTQARRLEAERPPLADPELLAAALEAPRWSAEPNGSIRIESRIPAEIRRHLEKLGHDVVRIGPWQGSGFFQAMRFLEDGVCLGATDPRGEGAVIGL